MKTDASVSLFSTSSVSPILSGNITPSGKISDTFWKHHYMNPVLANFGTLTNGAENPLVNQWRQARKNDVQNSIGQDIHNDAVENIVYQEGIYMYGLSYTTFAYSGLKVTEKPKASDRELKDDKYIVEITVTNTGDRAGKD